MPKIKNWSKQGEDVWRHERKDVRVKIMQNPRMGNHPLPSQWSVRVSEVGRGVAIEHPQNFDTKEDARNWATEWMREHPNS